jgi:hypothetical protein
LSGDVDEGIFYDDLHRPGRSELNSVQNLDLSYDAMGNILMKSDVSASNWSYHASKKHAVLTAGTNVYLYGKRSTNDVVAGRAKRRYQILSCVFR